LAAGGHGQPKLGAENAACRSAVSSRAAQMQFIHSPLGGGTGYERGTLWVRGDVLLGVALQASLMAECFADGAGDADGGIGVSELVGAPMSASTRLMAISDCVTLDALRVGADRKGIAFISSQVVVDPRVSPPDELSTIKR
jgi:hypothetical protein